MDDPRWEALQTVLDELNRTYENLGAEATAEDYLADLYRLLSSLIGKE